MLKRRRAGLLLHPTSLPGRHAVGDIGATAQRFVDWLAEAGFAWWQMLPLSLPGSEQCPYVSSVSLAGNTLLLDLDALVADGLLRADELPPVAPAGTEVDFGLAVEQKRPLIARAAERLVELERPQLREWQAREPWVEEAALFLTIKEQLSGAPWWSWPAALRDGERAALADFTNAHRARIDELCAEQLLFDRQWRALMAYAHRRGVRVLGDLPIYVDRDSHDVWASRDLFQLDAEGKPLAVAGVPPDYFSALGQLWGNPLYDWPRHAATGFAWWIARMRRTLQYADTVRLDHFRAFAAYWRVPSDAPDARSGAWVDGPGAPLFEALRGALGELPLLAEDLGAIDQPVHALRDTLGLPGMRVLQFGFDGDYANLHHPRNHVENSVCYTGTHDNDTTLGWWQAADEALRHRVRVDLSIPALDIAWDMIRVALGSRSRLSIVPMQDILRLGSEARMNHPGVAQGNWRWRLRDLDLPPDLAPTLRTLLAEHDRLSD